MRAPHEWFSNRPGSIAHRLSARPAAAIVLAFVSGITGSLFCRTYAFWGLAAGAGILVCASLLALLRNRVVLALAAGLAAITICGFMASLAHRDARDASDLRRLISQQQFPLNEPVSFEGCVIEESRKLAEDTSATIELTAFLQKDRWAACKGNGILRIASPDPGDAAPQGILLARGDRIRAWAVWQQPLNYKNPGSSDRAGQLARRGIYLIGRTKSRRLLERIPGGCTDPWTETAAAANAHVRSNLDPLPHDPKDQRAAILASLLIGDYSGLDNTTREVFQNSGTYHVLVVSGLHVAWISGVLLQFFKLIRLPERLRYLLAAFMILLYTCVVGFQASITRCLWMFLLYLLSRMIFRRAEPANILLVSALILLVANPTWLFETGFQLSFLSVMAIAMTALPATGKILKPLFDPLIHSGNTERLFLTRGRWQRYGRILRTRCEILIEERTDSLPPYVARGFLCIARVLGASGLAGGAMILTSVSVQLWIEPLLAHNFNRLSWISPIANLAMVPLSSITLAAGIAAALTSGIPCIGPAFLSLAGSLAALLLRAALFITDIPGAWQRCPTLPEGWILAGILILFAWTFFEWRRFWIPCAYIAALLGCLSIVSIPVAGSLAQKWRHMAAVPDKPAWPSKSSRLQITILDVGEGDSIIIRFPDGRAWVLDAGGLRLPPSSGENAYAFDIGEAVVSRYLWHEWITQLDRVILSHADQDHAGGMASVLKNFRASRFSHSAAGTEPMLASILRTAHDKGTSVCLLQAGMEERVGPVHVRTLHPPADFGSASTNDNSIVIQFSFGKFSALLTGDLERPGEADLLSRRDELRSRLLKVAHHGSRSGTSDAFLDRAKPRWAVISVGRNNPFGHPSRQVMDRLRRHGTAYFLTMEDGAVSIETDGHRYGVRSHVRGILECGVLQ